MAGAQGCPQRGLLKSYIRVNHLGSSRKGISVRARNRDVLDVKELTERNDLPVSTLSATLLSPACFTSYSYHLLDLAREARAVRSRSRLSLYPVYSHTTKLSSSLVSGPREKKENRTGHSLAGGICSSSLQKNVHTLDTGAVQDGLEVLHLLQKGCTGRNSLFLCCGGTRSNVSKHKTLLWLFTNSGNFLADLPLQKGACS